ncbi:MAG: tRNA pseudouridine(38-40) synthase TruA [Magnetococcales bacterium]|nr:tRNA pseudouridine(38-40) synthase TruA [Magnetococcales bacterium]
MARFRLEMEYDGSCFHGWQRQVGHLSVQEALEQALSRLCGHSVTVIGAGRTDAGVHALGQVAHFDTHKVRPESAIQRAVNALTPAAVTVTQCTMVDERFHARFSACYREYLYRIGDPPWPAVFERCYRLHHPGRLDDSKMAQAAAWLLGSHDFSAFRAAECQAKTAVRHVSRLELCRHGDEIRMVIGADGFLYHMVRNIVGSLLLVGQGRWSVEQFVRVAQAGNRQAAGPTAPPHGLYLVRVLYHQPRRKGCE